MDGSGCCRGAVLSAVSGHCGCVCGQTWTREMIFLVFCCRGIKEAVCFVHCFCDDCGCAPPAEFSNHDSALCLRLKQSIFAHYCHNQENIAQKPHPKAAETSLKPRSEAANIEITTQQREVLKISKSIRPPNHPTAKTKCPAPATARVTRTLAPKPQKKQW